MNLDDLAKRYRSKDNRLIHDGDCWFWGLSICTCGLLHDITGRVDPDLWPEWYWKEKGAQDGAYESLTDTGKDSAAE